MSIFPERWKGRLIPIKNIPKFYIKDGKTYETRTNTEEKNKINSNANNNKQHIRRTTYFSNKNACIKFR